MDMANRYRRQPRKHIPNNGPTPQAARRFEEKELGPALICVTVYHSTYYETRVVANMDRDIVKSSVTVKKAPGGRRLYIDRIHPSFAISNPSIRSVV